MVIYVKIKLSESYETKNIFKELILLFIISYNVYL